MNVPAVRRLVSVRAAGPWYLEGVLSRQGVPAPSPVFVGREAEIRRVEDGLRRVSAVVIVGVGGVGKSALASVVAARWPGDVLHCKAASGLGAVIDDARRQLQGKRPVERASEDERLADLCERLDAGGCLWVIDDLHQLRDRARLLHAIGSSLRKGRLLATSRERIARAPGDPDRMELALDGLTREQAAELWGALDELYGPAAGFDGAFARTRGSPFQLRRAHAGGLDDEDPLAGALRSLAPDERRVAAALALAEARLPLAVVEGLLDGDRARAALRRLVTLLIVDVDGAGTSGMHDLFREAVRAQLDDATRRSLSLDLARLLEAGDGAGVPLARRVREVVRHWGVAGEPARAEAWLLPRVVELVHDGETAEALRALDAVPSRLRSPAARLARARCLAHLLDIPSAWDELERLVADGHGGLPEVRLARGELSLLRGRLSETLHALGELAADPGVPRTERLQALTVHAFALTSVGRGDEARARLADEEARTHERLAAAHLAHCRLRTLFLEEREDLAEEPMRRARALLPDTTLPYDAGVLVPMTFAAMLARQGRFEEVDALLDQIEPPGVRPLDPSSELYVKRMRAGILWERGDRVAAHDLLAHVADAYDRAGALFSALLVAHWVGRCRLVLGRREQGLRLLERTARRAAEIELAVVVAGVERARRFDPLIALDDPPGELPPEGKRGEHVRARAIRAVRAAAAGDVPTARALVDTVGRDANGVGYGVDRALAQLAAATLARLDGDAAEAGRRLEQAARETAHDGADPSLVQDLLEKIGKLRVVTGEASWVARRLPAPDARYDVVLDGRSHELRVKRRVISFKSRPVLRKLLYALASHPAGRVSKEALVTGVWDVIYNPLRHDNTLWVNVRRLRMAIANTGLKVEVDDEGYRLIVPKGFLYIDPSA